MLKYTAPVRRGFALLMGAVNHHTDHQPTDPQHPHRRVLQTAQERRDWDAAVQWVSQEFNQQADKDEQPAPAVPEVHEGAPLGT